MKVRWFSNSIALVLVLMCAFGVCLIGVTAAESTKPNVLFLIADDLNVSLGSYGHTQIETPNLDRLASEGVRFEHAYCQYPLCGPSRNSMLTGLYPNSTGIHQNSQIFRQTIPQHQSLPQAFRLDGYFAGRIGKLYHYNVPKSIGTNGHDDPGSWELELNPAGCDRLLEEGEIFSLSKNQFGGTLSWYASPRDDRLHTDGMLADDACWVLDRCATRAERPFFLAVGFYRPHTPYVAPEPYFEKYPRDQMPIVENSKVKTNGVPKAALESAQKIQDSMSSDLRREAIQAYYASISFMDAQVGRVLDRLDSLGLRDNTIIVFTSDHGYHLGEHGLWQKLSLFEESAQVPLIISAPGMLKNQVSNSPVGLIDLYPTLTELCSVKAPENLQGQSLVPMLKDSAAKGRGWTISQLMRGNAKQKFFGFSIRTPEYRYTEWDTGKAGRELYDHQSDPKEQTNLAEDPKYSPIIETLAKTLHAAIASTFPKGGMIPEVRSNVWAPNLTHP